MNTEFSLLIVIEEAVISLWLGIHLKNRNWQDTVILLFCVNGTIVSKSFKRGHCQKSIFGKTFSSGEIQWNLYYLEKSSILKNIIELPIWWPTFCGVLCDPPDFSKINPRQLSLSSSNTKMVLQILLTKSHKSGTSDNYAL